MPLKVETSGEQWSKWASKYPPEGRSIPIVYVIRADGEKLYGKSGALPGEQLPQMLTVAVQQSGRSFNNLEFPLLATSVDKAKRALEANDKAAAIRALAGLRKLGKLGEISTASHSVVAKEADRLVNEIIESGSAEIEQAKSKLADPATAFGGILVLVEARRLYPALPELLTTVRPALRDVERDPARDALVNQAEAIDRARSHATQKSTTSKKKAITAYELVITRYPGTEADKLAREELAELNPDSEVLSSAGGEMPEPPPAGGGGYRVWADSTGEHKIEAILVEMKKGWVQLRKRDGQLIALPVANLSEEDQTFLSRDR